MFQSLVKVVTPCVVAIVIALSAAKGDSPANESPLIAFWREVFERPDVREVARTANTSLAMTELGRGLFHDPRLSRDTSRTCASCHKPETGFTDGRAEAHGLDGRDLQRNVPTLYNAGWGRSFNWDGSAPTLDQQISGPIENPNEMGGNFHQIIKRLRADSKTEDKFKTAFSGVTSSKTDVAANFVSRRNVVAALAAYVRSLAAPLTRFDDWVAGNNDALSSDELIGFRLFVGKGGCVGCHSRWRFTDDGFHDIGLPNPNAPPDAKTAGKKGIMAFKTPTLRALTSTAPYMHDGSLKTLEEVVAHYATGVDQRKGIAELLKPRINFTSQEKAQLIAFLKTL